MTQDQPAPPTTREDLESKLWELTEWRGGAETMNRLLAAIDEYADAKPGVRINVTEGLSGGLVYDETYAVPEISHPTRADLELVAQATNHRAVDEVRPALEDDLYPEPQSYDWERFGGELAKLARRAHEMLAERDGDGRVQLVLKGAELRRLGELSELFGDVFAAAYWMRRAASRGDSLAVAWLRELGDGMAYTVTGEDLVPVAVAENAKQAFETRVDFANLKVKPPREWATAVPGASLEPKPGTATVHLVTITNPVPNVPGVEGVFEIEWDKVAPYVRPVSLEEATPSKTCRVCGVPKTLDEFPKDSSCKDGRRNQCKPCVNDRARKPR